MLILPPLSRAPDFKITRILLFVFFTFFIVGNSYADKIYKVQARDFLSKIVKKNYSVDDDLSKEQVMVAILRANPEAFRGGNIHFLKRVDALTLPSIEAVALIPHAEALQTVNKHYTFFKRKKTGNFPPIALKRPPQQQDNTNTKTDSNSISTSTETEISTVDGMATTAIETSTSSAENIDSTSSISDNKLKKQQQESTIKTEQIQKLEKRKGEQNATLDQLDNKIQTLEKSITNQTTTENTKPALQTETISGLDSLTDLSDKEETTTTESTEPALQTETISGLDSLTNLSSGDADNNTTEKNSDPKQPAYLWLLLPIFALLGFLWLKKSKTPSITDTDSTASLAKTPPPSPILTKEPHHPPSTAPTPLPTKNIDDIDALNNTEKSTIDSNEEESAIKLDMASAYQAMGYPEEAKEMLEEVIQEGTAQQKEMAESLLAVL